MGQATFKRMLQEAITRKGISHRELGKLTDPDDPERGRRRVQRHLRGTEPTAASRITYAKALDAPELAPDCVEGHRLVALVEEQPVPGPGCSSANTDRRPCSFRSPALAGRVPGVARRRALGMILVSEHTARWLLHEAERNPALAFNSFEPFGCKLCDEATAPDAQRAHVKAHRLELDKAAAKRRRESVRAMKQANRLRREAARA